MFALSNRIDHIVSFTGLSMQLADVFRSIFEVAIHGDDPITTCEFQSGGNGHCISEVSGELDNGDTGVRVRKMHDFRHSPIYTTIVNKNNLVILGYVI